MEKKICAICKLNLDLTSDNFYKDKSKKCEFSLNCKNCETIKRTGKEYIHSIKRVDYINNLKTCFKCNIEKPLNLFEKKGFRNQKIRYRSNCKTCCKESRSTIDGDINYKRYNISKEDYLNKVENQNNCCKICGGKNIDGKLFIDHDHATGKVRDLLCRHCNSGIGFFKDNIENMRKAIEYINYHNM